MKRQKKNMLISGSCLACPHRIPLQAGDNLVSSYLVPTDLDMEVVFADLMTSGKLVLVRNSVGEQLEELFAGFWGNNIGDWVSTEGYIVRMNDAAVLEITGTQFNPVPPIILNSTYNIIAYPYNFETDALVAFDNILDNLDYVEDEDGLTLEKVSDVWVNNIGNLKPGEGYQVALISTPQELIYNI
jgi:hypothetical protein